jgi:hypothetical protein
MPKRKGSLQKYYFRPLILKATNNPPCRKIIKNKVVVLESAMNKFKSHSRRLDLKIEEPKTRTT